MRLPLLLVSLAAVCSATRVHMSSVTALTFKRDAWTTARRGQAIPQLTCVGGPCGDAAPAVVQCTSTGFDGVNPQVCYFELYPLLATQTLRAFEHFLKARDFSRITVVECNAAFDLI